MSICNRASGSVKNGKKTDRCHKDDKSKNSTTKIPENYIDLWTHNPLPPKFELMDQTLRVEFESIIPSEFQSRAESNRASLL